MKIDMHQHLTGKEGELEELVETYDRLGFDKVVLFGGGPPGIAATNRQVLEAARKYPDLIIPFAYISLGVDTPNTVDEFYSLGFKGLKAIWPLSDYHDKAFYPVYARAEQYGMPILFHLGIVMRSPMDKALDVDCNRMRPIYLDTIARAFPDLKIIGAHLGNPWYEEAAMTARWNPNVYFDLSGSTLKKKTPEFIGDLLWWDRPKRPKKHPERYTEPLGRAPFEKIVFGSDVQADEVEEVVSDYQNVLDKLKISPEIQAKVFGETAREILGL